MMNILVLSWRGPGHPHAGGAEVSTHEHSKGWVKAGHSVTLFTAYYNGAKREEVVDGVNIIRRGGQFFRVHWEAFQWYVFENHPKYDLVVDQFHGIPFFTPLYVKAKKIAFIHEVTKEVWKLNPWPKPFNLLPAVLGTYLEPLIFKTFYKKIPFMTVSDSTKNDLIDWGIPENNISVVQNGFTFPNYPRQRKETKKTVIYLGALSKDKGIEDALEAFKNIFKFKKDYQFWVAGKGESHYLKYLKKKTRLFGIDKVTKFFGFVNEKKKYELLARAHILINPSIREGWGFVVIEAASQGTPTVAYNVAGLKDSVVDGKTGLLCDPNPKDCAQKIMDLLDNQSVLANLSGNCIRRSRKFSWTDSVGESLRLLKKVAQKEN